MKYRRDGKPDGRSRRASFQHWMREHWPRTYLGLHAQAGDELARARERRHWQKLFELGERAGAAVACCVECHSPLILNDEGWHLYCPYELHGQHQKAKAANGLTNQMSSQLDYSARSTGNVER